MKKFSTRSLAIVLCLSLVACTVDQVLDDIDVVVQIAGQLGEAVGAVSPADALIVAAFTGIATKGIQAIQSAYDTYKASHAQGDLQNVQAAISAVQSNLTQELAAAHVSNPAAQAKVAAWVNLVQTSITAIAAALPALSTTPAGKRQIVLGASLPSPETLQARWTMEVCGGAAACAKKVKAHRHHFFRF